MDKTNITGFFLMVFLAVQCPPALALDTQDQYIARLHTAAQSGNAEAQYNLGNAYALGLGMQKNMAEAVRWFRSASEQGNAKAQTMLGTLYAEGTGVPKDHDEAVRWWMKAADQNNADAQDQLGFAYLLGDGVQRNYLEAYKWFHLAAAHGDQHAIRDRDSLARFMNDGLISEAKDMAEQWKKQHSNVLLVTKADPVDLIRK